MQNLHSTKRILFDAVWFEMGILGRKGGAGAMAFQVKKPKEYLESGVYKFEPAMAKKR